MATEKKYLIDHIDFSKVKEYITGYGGKLGVTPGDFRAVLESGYGIPESLVYVYVCKNYIEKPKDVALMINFLYLTQYLSKENKEIVFSVFNQVVNFKEMVNAIEKDFSTVSTWFRVACGYNAFEEMLDQLERFDQDTLQLFADVTGTNEFVNYVKKRRERNLEKIKKKEEKEKQEEEKREQEAEKRIQEEEKRLEKRKEKITKRLIKLAEKFERGDFRYSMRLPFDKDITADDIADLPKDNPGVRAMFAALVHGQTQIKTVKDLEVFNDMLQYMIGQFAPKTCLHHVSLEQLLKIGGFTMEDLEKPKKTAESIARYKKALKFIEVNSAIFLEAFDLRLTHTPHDRRVNIEQYDTPEALNLLIKAKDLSEKAYDEDKELRHTSTARVLKRAMLRAKRDMHQRKSRSLYNEAKEK